MDTEKLSYQRFFHTVISKNDDKNGHSEEFYDSGEGHCIPIGIYQMLRKKGYSNEEIWMKYSRKLQIRSEMKYPFIHNMKEYIDFLFTIMPEETVTKIKEGRKNCKNMQEAIRLFPEVYQPFLTLRDDYDKHGCKYYDTKILTKSITSEMPRVEEKKYYNKEAFHE